jgi:chorismate mutase
MLLKIAQKALDLCYDGLMIESHINPAVALSDAQHAINTFKIK